MTKNSNESQSQPSCLGAVSGSAAAEQVIAMLSHIFTNESRKHVGKKIEEVPELLDIVNAIDVVDKHCR
jgi:hypothetical protein